MPSRRSTERKPVQPVVVDGSVQISPEVRRRFRRLAWIYLIVSTGLLPWIVYLALSLPKRNLEHHYRSPWVGFDPLLVLALAGAAYLAFRMDPRVQFPATAAATLLVVDAWFDVTTSDSRRNMFTAMVLAVLVELPAAAFSLYAARRGRGRGVEKASPDTV